MPSKITSKLLEKLTSDDPRGRRIYDSDLRGFAAVVYPGPKIVFEVRYGGRRHRRRMRLGEFGNPLTLDAARKKARELLAGAALGGDPAKDRKEKTEMPTFAEWSKDYLEEIEPKRKSAKTMKYYLGLASKRFGTLRLDQIDAQNIAALHASMKDRRVLANRALATVSACFSLALRRGLIGRNPCIGIEPFPENPPRDRVLSEVELRRLNKAISAEEDVIVAAAFRLMLETGARAGEVLAAKWEDMDLKGLRWRLPSPKAGIPQTIFLAPQTAKWLKKVPRVDKNPYVIPGEIEGARRFDLKRAWRRMQRNAAIPGVNIHDLRRTVGKLIAREAGLQAAQKALRHSDVQLTASTYAPMQEAEVREAMAKVIPLLRRTA